MKKPGKIRTSLKNSFIDGCFAAAMLGFIEQYIIPFAVALKATSAQVGMLAAFPSLVSSLVQLKSADVTEHLKSRRRILSIFIFFHSLMFIPIILIPFVFKENRVFWLIIFVIILNSLAAFPAPAWSSLMTDHIPPSARGKYFGWRNRLTGAITVACAFAAGFILNIFGKGTYMGFAVIFASACLARFISWYFLSKMYEPHLKVTSEHYFNFWDFIKRARQSNFAKFVFFAASINFSVYVASPFFAVYMLRNLNFTYVTYTIIVTASTITTLLVMNVWGRHADRVGNLKVIRLTSYFIPVVPALWIFSHNVYYLIAIQIVAGFAWAGFNLCVVNFIYDSVTPEKRTRCVSYFNVINGCAICFGALLGGVLSKTAPPVFGSRLLTLFLLSGIMRGIFAGIFLPMIKEVRPVQKIKNTDFFLGLIGLGSAKTRF